MGRAQTKAGKETAVSVANRDSRSYNICVSTYKLDFFCLSAIFSFFFESYALFSDRNENI